MQRSGADVNSPYKRKCWTNSGGPLVNTLGTLRSSYVPGIYFVWRKAIMSRDWYWSLPVGGFLLCRFFRGHSHVLFSVLDPYLFIWYGSGSSILGWNRFGSNQDPSRVLMTKNRKNSQLQKSIFFWPKTTIYQFTAEALSSQKRTSSTSKHEIS